MHREDWRVLDEPDSPREREGTVDWDQAIEDELDTELRKGPAAVAQPIAGTDPSEAIAGEALVNMDTVAQDRPPIFVKPSLDQASSRSNRRPLQSDDASPSIEASLQYSLGLDSQRPTDTPQLRPIPSPGLPIPSPIISNNNTQEYFEAFHASLHTPATQLADTDINSAAHLAESSLAAAAPLTQQYASQPFAEEPEATESHAEFNFMDGTVRMTASVGPTTFFDPQMSEAHQELRESDIEIEEQNPPGEFTGLAVDALSNRETGMMVEPDGNMELDGMEVEMETAKDVGYEEAMGVEEEDQIRGDELRHDHTIEHEKTSDDEESEEEDSVAHFQSEALHENYGDEEGISAIPLHRESRPPNAPIETVELKSFEIEAENSIRDEAMQDETADISIADPYSDYSDDVAEDEPLSDEENAESMSDVEEAKYEDEDELDEEGFRLAQQSHAQVAEPEVIVLDSDSEDELASEQPMPTPSQSSRCKATHEGAQAAAADRAVKDAETSRYAVKEDSDADESDRADQNEQGVRVHDRNLEDESSVDELAQDRNNEDSMQEGSDEQEQEDEDDDSFPHEQEGDSAEEDVQSDYQAGFSPATAIELDADSDEDAPPSNADGPHGERDLAEDDEVDGLSHPRFAPRGFDGTDERSTPRRRSELEVERPESSDRAAVEAEELSVRSLDGTSIVQTATASLTEQSTLISAKLDQDEQLLTSGVTQDVVPHHRDIPIRHKAERPVALNMREPSLSPTTSLEGEPAIETSDVPIDTKIPKAVHGIEKWNDSVARMEPVHTVEKVDDHLATPAAPTVLINKPLMPDRHAHGLRTKLSYFAPLAALVEHYNALIDTISVVNETTPIAKAASGSKDYYMTIQLTDPSLAGTTLQAQIFRRYKSALPAVSDGSTVLLRNFKVRSYDHSIMLVSVDSSAWAVFDGSSPDAEMNGPPVEYGSEERAYASGLRRWYREVGESMAADHRLQASIERETLERELTPSDVASSEVGSIDSVSRGDSVQSARGSRRSRKRHRRITIHELRDGTRYTEVGSPSSRESIHELRDGTVYANI